MGEDRKHSPGQLEREKFELMATAANRCASNPLLGGRAPVSLLFRLARIGEVYNLGGGRRKQPLHSRTRGRTRQTGIPPEPRSDFGKAVRQGLAARGETPAAFGRRCIPADCVAPPSHMDDMLSRRALSAGRLAALGATLASHHGLLRNKAEREQEDARAVLAG